LLETRNSSVDLNILTTNEGPIIIVLPTTHSSIYSADFSVNN